MVSVVNIRISSLFDFMNDDKLKDDCKMNKVDFTRKSPLDFVNLILIFLIKSGLSNTMELTNFFNQIGELKVTKEALSQSRLKLKPIVFKILKIHYLTMIYDNSTEKFKNHLLLACDGSKIELPHHKSLIKIYGGTKNKFHEIKSCMANSNSIYDVLNGYIIDFEIDTYRTSEKTLIFRNLANLFQMKFLKNVKKIFIFDRGYRSIEFFHYLMKKEEKFVFRIRTNDYKKEKMKLRRNDQSITIKITKNRVKHIKNLKLKSELLKMGKLNLRIIRVKLITGEIEYLITNLDQENFQYKDITEIYRLRWQIEVSFKTLKNLLKIENISGYSEIAVQQDTFSQILAFNIINDIKNTTQKIKNKNTQNSKHEKKKQGKINTNIVIGHFKLKIIPIYNEKNKPKREKIVYSLIIHLTKHYTNTSTKKYEHPKNTPPRKNPTNSRRSF